MIKFPDIVNIEEVIYYDGDKVDIEPVVGFILILQHITRENRVSN